MGKVIMSEEELIINFLKDIEKRMDSNVFNWGYFEDKLRNIIITSNTLGEYKNITSEYYNFLLELNRLYKKKEISKLKDLIRLSLEDL